MEGQGNSFELVESRDALELLPRWEIEGWWFFAAAGLIIAVLFAVMLFRRKKGQIDTDREKREAYVAAKKDLENLLSPDARETATGASLALRGYLARSMAEPALFETQEEFVGRHEALKDLPEEVKASTGSFFTKLAAMKYAPDDMVPAADGSLKTEGLELLERIHRA